MTLIGRVIKFAFEFRMYHDDGPETIDIIETVGLLEKVEGNRLYLLGENPTGEIVPCRNIKSDIELLPLEEEIVWKLEHNM